MTRGVLWGCAVGVLMSCAPPVGGTVADAGAAADAGPIAALYDQLDEARCTFEDRCQAVRGRRYVDHADCVAGRAAARALAAATSRVQLEDNHVVGGHAAECLEQLRVTAACTTQVIPACEDVLDARDPIPLHEPCMLNQDFCAPGLSCRATGARDCTTCEPLLPDGAACAIPDDCVSHQCVSDVCQSTATAAAQGEECGPFCVCLGNLGRTGQPPWVCVARPGLGQPCSSQTWELPCLQGLACDDASLLCAALPRVGDPCTGTCFAAYCAVDAPGAMQGTCKAYTDLPGAGSPCGRGKECGAGTFPLLTGSPSTCTCTPLLPLGTACTPPAASNGYARSCQEGSCVRDALGAAVCANPQANGAACVSFTECASGACSLGASGLAGQCSEAQCTVAPSCQMTPANLTAESAAPLALSTITTADLCLDGPGAHQYWALPAFAPSSGGLRVRMWSDAAFQGVSALVQTYGAGVSLNVECPFLPRGGWTDCDVQGPLAGTGGLHVDVFSRNPQPVGAQVHFLVMPLAPAPACIEDIPSTNTSPATATQFMLGERVEAQFCTGSDPVGSHHWKVTGDFAAGKTYRLRAHVQDGGVGTGWLDVAWDAGDASPSQRISLNADTLDWYLVLTAPTSTITLRTMDWYILNTRVALAFTMEEVPEGDGACPDGLPANTSAATATPLHLGETTPGRFCSRASQVDFFWTLAAPLGAGDVVGFTVVRQDGTQLQRLGEKHFIGMLLAESGQAAGPAECTPFWPGVTSHCFMELQQSVTSVTFKTTSNPSGGLDVPFTITPSLVTDPGFRCDNPPTNWRWGQPAAFTLGEPVTAHICTSDFAVSLRWEAGGTFPQGTRFAFTTPGFADTFLPASIRLQATNAAGDTVGATLCDEWAGEDCVMALSGDAVAVGVAADPGSFANTDDETFTFRVDRQ